MLLCIINYTDIFFDKKISFGRVVIDYLTAKLRIKVKTFSELYLKQLKL